MKPIEDLAFISGSTALDFINTAEREHPHAGDALLNVEDLRTWGVRYGVLSKSARVNRDAEEELARVREVRELLYTLFRARVRGRSLPRDQLACLAELVVEAYGAGTFVASDGRVSWNWDRSRLSSIRCVVVVSAADLLETPPSPRLKQCPGNRCGWLFIDTTKGGNRRWCSMRECGQQVKDERRRERHSEPSVPTQPRRTQRRDRTSRPSRG